MMRGSTSSASALKGSPSSGPRTPWAAVIICVFFRETGGLVPIHHGAPSISSACKRYLGVCQGVLGLAPLQGHNVNDQGMAVPHCQARHVGPTSFFGGGDGDRNGELPRLMGRRLWRVDGGLGVLGLLW